MSESWAANLQRCSYSGPTLLVNWWRMLPWLRSCLTLEWHAEEEETLESATKVLSDVEANPGHMLHHLCCDSSVMLNCLFPAQQQLLHSRLFSGPQADANVLAAARAEAAIVNVGDPSSPLHHSQPASTADRVRRWVEEMGSRVPQAFRRRASQAV